MIACSAAKLGSVFAVGLGDRQDASGGVDSHRRWISCEAVLAGINEGVLWDGVAESCSKRKRMSGGDRLEGLCLVIYLNY